MKKKKNIKAEKDREREREEENGKNQLDTKPRLTRRFRTDEFRSLRDASVTLTRENKRKIQNPSALIAFIEIEWRNVKRPQIYSAAA